MLLRTALAFAAAMLAGVEAHLAIQYPGSRGYNAIKNGTTEETNGLGVLDNANQQPLYPYGMQFIYPCGGLPVSTNRTLWPLTGTAPLIFQTGHQGNHDWGMIWVNMGLGTIPHNFTSKMMHEFSFTFPSAVEYLDHMCLPELTLPSAFQAAVARGEIKAGDNATIQVIETTKDGGSLCDCVDITFTASTYPSNDVPDVSTMNLQCTNGTEYQFANVTYGEWSGSGDGYSKNQSLALGLGLGLPLIAICCVLGFFLWRSVRLNKKYKASGQPLGMS